MICSNVMPYDCIQDLKDLLNAAVVTFGKLCSRAVDSCLNTDVLHAIM